MCSKERRIHCCDEVHSHQPLSFCGHRWLENEPVIERALEVWPSLTQYMDAVSRKRLPNPGTTSFDTVEEAMKDTLIVAKLHFSLTVARLFSPFLKRYQTDEPVILSNDLDCVSQKHRKLKYIVDPLKPMELRST